MKPPHYVRWQAALGHDDLHPGGVASSRLLAAWLEPWRGGRLVELGAGAGRNAARLSESGWDVVALEPDPVLAGQCAARGVRTERVSAEGISTVCAHGSLAAVIAESVLFQVDLPKVLRDVHACLRPGGALAFSELVWSARADAATAARVHDLSESAFGIAVASRERWTWVEWEQMLQDAGFTIVRREPAPPGEPWRPSWRKRMQHPLAALATWRAHHAGTPELPDDWFEGWCVLATRDGG